jgi:hypothetical protein
VNSASTAPDSAAGAGSWRLPLAAALIVFGFKLALIGGYGHPIPFWDQWDAEAASLYKPYLESRLSLAELFDAHNEHRIMFTKLIALAELELAGVWDPVVQMIVNAALHSGFAAMLVALLGASMDRRRRVMLAAATVVAFFVPFGWENLLAGFQSQFYLMQIFSVCAIALLISRQPFRGGWLAGLGLAVCAYFSLASGAFAALASAILCGLQIVTGSRGRDLRNAAGIGVLLAAAAAMVAFTPSIPGHAHLKAQGVVHFLDALFRVSIAPTPVAPLLHIPLLMLAWRMMARPAAASRADWLILALGGWVFMQMVSLAYGRATGTTSSRYMDLLIVLFPLDFAALMALMDSTSAGRAWRAVAAWAFVAVAGIAAVAPARAFAPLAEKHAQSVVQSANVRRFVETGDMAVLRGKPVMDLPYPDPERLAGLITDGSVRLTLHPEVTGSDRYQAELHSLLFTAGALTGATAALRSTMLLGWPAWLLAGLAMLWSSLRAPRRGISP